MRSREPSTSSDTPSCVPPTPIPDPLDMKKWTVLRRGWKTSVALSGCYLLAFTCAATHYAIFTYLDGRVLGSSDKNSSFDSTGVTQSYVTTASLVLVTGFRAALVATISLSYAQYLWKNLRSRLLTAGLIEELFQIRSNPLRLLNYALLRSTPALLAIATFSWLVPVAMIYPPGALVVGRESRNVVESFNVSVFQPNNTYSRVKSGTENLIYNGLSSVWEYDDDNKKANPLDLCDQSGYCNYMYGGPIQPLGRLATKILTNAELANLDRPLGDDLSYTLHFQGPVLQCREANETSITTFTEMDFQPIETINDRQLKEPIPTYSIIWNTGKLTMVSITEGRTPYPLYSPCDQTPKNVSGVWEDSWFGDVDLILPITIMNCSAATARYKVDISFINGVQNINYSTTETQVLPHYDDEDGIPMDEPDVGMPQNSNPLQSMEEYINMLALTDALLSMLQYEGMYLIDIPYTQTPSSSSTPTHEEIHLSNGSSTVLEVCQFPAAVCPLAIDQANPLMALSVFSPQEGDHWERCLSKSLVITEALLNEVLANITISALSLNTWVDSVNGTVVKHVNVYLFERKLNFFLPYGLCLLLAIPIIGLGIMAHCDNGVSAIDGGFLQVLMTTTGRTQLEKCAMKGSIGGYENVPKELEQLKIRFGELLLHEDVDRGSVHRRSVHRGSVHKGSVGRRSADRGSADRGSVSRGSGDRTSLNGEDRVTEQGVSEEQPQMHHDSDNTLYIGGQGGSRSSSLDSGVATPASGPRLLRRAGFGTLEETRPLKRGIRYGYDTV